jgi:hypothetical protein
MARWSTIKPLTICLDPEAEQFLRGKVTTPRGFGRYLSVLLHREAMREELREEQAQQAKDTAPHGQRETANVVSVG